MNKINEDLEVKINEGIAKSFDISAQIFDEINDIDVIYEKYRQRRQQSVTENKIRSPQVKKISSALKNVRNPFEDNDNNSIQGTTAQPNLLGSDEDIADNNYQKRQSKIVDCFPTIDGKYGRKVVLQIPIQNYVEQSRLLEGYRDYKIKLSEQQIDSKEQDSQINDNQSYFSKIATSVSGFISKQ